MSRPERDMPATTKDVLASISRLRGATLEEVAADLGWWLALDLVVILVITGLLVLRDLSVSNRPFDWWPVICSAPLVSLVLIQSLVVAIVLIVLVGFGRATLKYGADALWVSLAG